MRNLYNFLYRIRVFLLFLVLEFIAFSWIQNSRSYQRSSMVHSANRLTGDLLEKTRSLQNFIQLSEQNQQLSDENARLRSLAKEAYLPIYRSRDTIMDTLYQTRYTFQQARVVSSSYHKQRNYMTVNRGKLHGVKAGMGVIGSEGIVGVINNVSPHFSTVIPLINPSFSVSGKLTESGFFGPVQWNGSDYRYAYLIDIPRYALIEKGDTVVTDERSMIFPEGLRIGYVESYELQEDQNFFTVKLRLANDFSSTNYVYIVEDELKDELTELQKQNTAQ